MKYKFIYINLDEIKNIIERPDEYDLEDLREAIREIRELKSELDELEQQLKQIFIKKLELPLTLEEAEKEKEELELDYINVKRLDKKLRIEIDLEKL